MTVEVMLMFPTEQFFAVQLAGRAVLISLLCVCLFVV